MNSESLQWSEDEEEVEVTSLRDLVSNLDHLTEITRIEKPIIVTLHVHGAIVGFGIGLPLSFIQIYSDDNEPPYWITVGNTNEEGEVVFFLHGLHHTEMPRRNLIPFTEVRRLVINYFETGTRSVDVDWEQV